jgi:hypothetical protein
MKDPNEIRALKASFLGASETAAALHALNERVQGIDEHADVPSDLLDELSRVTAAHAIASNALRGLVNTIRTRSQAATAS